MNPDVMADANWKRAIDDFDLANENADNRPDAAANRAYFAAFHAVTALLALEGTTYVRHSAVRSAVHRDMVRTGRWSVELGESYDMLFELRHVGDYGGALRVPSEDARKGVEAARAVLRSVHEAHPETFVWWADET
jgi:uncharacterized protein (UPF0332 family)